MYPDFRYLLGALGIEAPQWVGLFKTFGLLVAISFLAAAWVLTQELKRKERLGLFRPDEREETVNKPVTTASILLNAIIGFIVGYKFIGLIVSGIDAEADPLSYIFSLQGSVAGGFAGAVLVGGWRLWDAQKLRGKQPEKKRVLLWPHQRVGEMVMLAALTGFAGAKIFNAFESWDHFTQDPIGSLISSSGFTFYGGLLTATAFFVIYTRRRGWDFRLLADCLAPALMLAYGTGRLGCQLSGDGDWGIANSAYVTDATTGSLRPTTSDTGFLQTAARYPGFTQSEYSGGKPHYARVEAPGWLPRRLVAMNYPHNVNRQGIPLAGCTGDYCTVLPFGVFPTPVYEAVVCVGLFGLLWAYRRRITRVPLRMTGLYFFLNGFERFWVEKIRVNYKYDWGFLHPTQAEIIAVGLMVAGLGLLIYTARRRTALPAAEAPAA